MIGVILPGLPTITSIPLSINFFIMNIREPKKTPTIGIFQMEKFQEEYCATVYYSTPPFSKLSYVGYITNERPSDIFYTAWDINFPLDNIQQINIMIRMQKIDNIKFEMGCQENNDPYLVYAHQMALNLSSYLNSVNQNFKQNLNNDDNYLLIPSSSLEDWYNQFLKKMNIDKDDLTP